MRIKETKVYQFDELDDDAKEKARQWYREGGLDYDWWDCVYEDAAEIAERLGIDLRQKPVKLMNGSTRYDPCIWFEGFGIQGQGACYEGRYRYAKGCLKEIKSYAPKDTELHRIAAELTEIQKRYQYGITATILHRGRGCHSYSMEIEVAHDTREIADDDYESIRQLLRDFADWIFDQLEREHDYRMSDEVVDEEIRANEYEFDESGRRS